MKTKNLSWKWHEQNTKEEHSEEKALARQKKTLRVSAGALAIALLIGLSSCGSAGSPSLPSPEQSAEVATTQAETEQGKSTQDESAQAETEQDQSAQAESEQDKSAQGASAQAETEQDRSAQGETAQVESAQDETEQSKSAQGEIAQAESEQDKSAQDESAQAETEQDKSTQGEIAQIGTEQDKPVQVEPAQESAATSTGQQDTASFVGASARTANQSGAVDLASIPAFSGEPYATLNGNVPGFSDSDLTTSSFESYSEMDSLGRCGTAYACIGTDLMPTEERGEIGQVRPSGWHTIKYDIIDGIYLYNRCHLIGYQLAGENANVQNLITGTRYMNIEGMLPFEEMVADYVKETGNHVLYRVTPIFEGNNLLASGVHMEAESVEDKGDGISFNVYCYNVQPGILIDYTSGDSELDGTAYANSARDGQEAAANMDNSAGDGQETATNMDNSAENTTAAYILNTNTHKFHYPYCSSVNQMSEKNKEEFNGTREDAIAMGYEPCKRCNP